MLPPSKTVLTTLYVGDDHCAAIHRNLLLMVVHQDPRPDLEMHQARWIARMRKEATSDLGFIVILRPGAPPPKEAARTTIRRAFEQYSGTMSFGAIVVEKSGFTAAAQRSALSVMILAARTPYPLKVFGTVREACRWVVRNLSEATRVSADELITDIESLKSAYEDGTLRVSP